MLSKSNSDVLRFTTIDRSFSLGGSILLLGVHILQFSYLVQQFLHSLIRFLSIIFLPLEEALPHQDYQHAWEDEEIAHHGEVTRQGLHVGELDEVASKIGI